MRSACISNGISSGDHSDVEVQMTDLIPCRVIREGLTGRALMDTFPLAVNAGGSSIRCEG
jgi:hypothetical protein